MNIEQHARLHDYLIKEGHITRNECPEYVTLTGGVSNRTVWVRHENRPDWVIKQALEKLRVQVDWFSAPERIHREAAGLRWLGKIIPGHVPDYIFSDDTRHLLAMSAIPQPHQNWKTMLLHGHTRIEYACMFGRLLAGIHNASGNYPELQRDFIDRRFFEELRLEPYYQFTASQVPQARSFLRELITDTRQHNLALVHGDYSPKNVLVHCGKLMILDFEVIHFGDPAFDLGFSMTHLLSKAHYLPARRSEFLKMAGAYWREYARTRRNGALARRETAAVRHTLACMLARVAGRSPLEYFNQSHRQRQQHMALQLIEQEISTVPGLIRAFGSRLDNSDERD